MSETWKLSPRERAKRYRELANEARVQAAHSKGEQWALFTRFVGQWEQLAREADDETEAEN